MTADPKRSVRLDWAGEGLRFRGGGTYPVTPTIEIDGDNGSAPGPMLVLLLAAAGCTAADVVLILEKTRVELSALSVAVDGTRRDQDPRRARGRLRLSCVGDLAGTVGCVDGSLGLAFFLCCPVPP